MSFANVFAAIVLLFLHFLVRSAPVVRGAAAIGAAPPPRCPIANRSGDIKAAMEKGSRGQAVRVAAAVCSAEGIDGLASVVVGIMALPMQKKGSAIIADSNFIVAEKRWSFRHRHGTVRAAGCG